MKWDVFLAYAGADGARVDPIEGALRRYRVFRDRTGVEAGQRWPTELRQALSQSRVMVVILSEHASKAWYVEDEVVRAVAAVRAADTAWRRDLPGPWDIVPVRLDPVDPPYGLAALNRVDWPGGDIDGAVLSAMRRRQPFRTLEPAEAEGLRAALVEAFPDVDARRALRARLVDRWPDTPGLTKGPDPWGAVLAECGRPGCPGLDDVLHLAAIERPGRWWAVFERWPA